MRSCQICLQCQRLIDRYSAACLALGTEAPPPSFYATMKSASSSACVSQPLLPASISYSTTASASTDNTASATSCDVIEQWRTVSNRVEVLLGNLSYNGDDVGLALSRMGQRLDSVHTGSQLCSFLHSFGQTALRRYRTGAAIHTQPTAAARRKRPRLLATNISSGVPHAKSHGKGH